MMPALLGADSPKSSPLTMTRLPIAIRSGSACSPSIDHPLHQSISNEALKANTKVVGGELLRIGVAGQRVEVATHALEPFDRILHSGHCLFRKEHARGSLRSQITYRLTQPAHAQTDHRGAGGLRLHRSDTEILDSGTHIGARLTHQGVGLVGIDRADDLDISGSTRAQRLEQRSIASND